MLFFSKKPESISRANPGFEENERKTPKAGIVLLLAMFIAGVFFGWLALDDLAKIPSRPTSLSSCGYFYNPGFLNQNILPLIPAPSPLFREYQNSYYNFSDSSRCVFNDLENESDVIKFFSERIPLEKQLQLLQVNLTDISNILSPLENNFNQSTKEYDVSLQEKQAGIENPIFPSAKLGNQTATSKEKIDDLQNQKNNLENQQKDIESKIKIIDDKLKIAYKPIFERQNHRLRWYEFEVFLLQMLFALPFFFIIFKKYLSLLKKNSPHAIIFTAILAVATILLLRVLLFWFWGLFLARVLEVLIRWFNKFELLKSIVLYTGMILSFAVFGGAVYFLQKKIFDPRRVTLRRFKRKQCPRCEANLDLSVFYCPNCRHQIREKCAICGNPRIIGLPSCPYCGQTTSPTTP